MVQIFFDYSMCSFKSTAEFSFAQLAIVVGVDRIKGVAGFFGIEVGNRNNQVWFRARTLAAFS